MIVVGLDSTTPAGSLALRLRDGAVDLRAGDPARSWSERLPGDVLTLLDEHRLRPADVEIFAVAAGPGSLTGLRVGIATIQGLAFATGRPVAAVSALDALAERGRELAVRGEAVGRARPPLAQVGAELVTPASREEPRYIGAWTNAMRGEVFNALYRPRIAVDTSADPWDRVAGPHVATPAIAAAEWRRWVGSHRLVVVGDVEEALTGGLGDAFGRPVELHPRPLLAAYVVTLALRQATRGALSRPHEVRPLYVRKPDAVLARERAREAAPSQSGGA